MDSSPRHRHTRPSSRSTSPLRPAPYHTQHHHHQPTTSRWQQLVVGASSAAGTTAAVISEDSMKCLKYCLTWLQYAIKHIDQQMVLLKNFLVSMATASSAPSQQLIPPPRNQTPPSVLSDIKKDIVETLRKVVEVITRYAGSSLPAQARQSVRGCILNLPGKWSNLNDIRSTHTSPAGSPMLGPKKSPMDINYKQEEAAIRLLSFGHESVDMLNSVSVVFSDTIDRAELWIDRLKMVPGINSNSKGQDDNVRLPPIRTLNTPDHHIFDHNEKSAFDR